MLMLFSPSLSFADSWAGFEDVQGKWKAFSEEHMSLMREEFEQSSWAKRGKKFEMKWTELNPTLFKKYFPDHKFFGEMGSSFAIDKSGSIIRFKNVMLLGRKSVTSPDLQIKYFFSFLEESDLKVTDSETAADVGRMIDWIQSSGRSNYKTGSPEDYRVTQKDYGWHVNTPDFSRGTSAYLHGDYKIITDEVGNIVDIMREDMASIIGAGSGGDVRKLDDI